jgi:hypothetical protein
VKSAHGRFEASGEHRRAIPRTHTSEELGREERIARKVDPVPCRQEKMMTSFVVPSSSSSTSSSPRGETEPTERPVVIGTRTTAISIILRPAVGRSGRRAARESGMGATGRAPAKQ